MNNQEDVKIVTVVLFGFLLGLFFGYLIPSPKEIQCVYFNDYGSMTTGNTYNAPMDCTKILPRQILPKL